MQIVEKYNYKDLKKQEGPSRSYLTPDGEALPSVTTILSRTKDKTFLKEWRARVGEEKAEKWAKDMVANFAKRPQGNDRAQVKAIHEGECEIALINNYYL